MANRPARPTRNDGIDRPHTLVVNGGVSSGGLVINWNEAGNTYIERSPNLSDHVAIQLAVQGLAIEVSRTREQRDYYCVVLHKAGVTTHTVERDEKGLIAETTSRKF